MADKRPLKHKDVESRVAAALQHDRVLLSVRANERIALRKITRYDLLYVLSNGRRERRKDTYNEGFGAWTYAYRGRLSEPDRELRVAIALLGSGVLVVTAIDLSASEQD